MTAALFKPFHLGPLTFKNRIVMAPMGTCLDRDGHITDDTIAYYARRARGGVGAITVEGCLVSPDSVGPEPHISGPEFLPGLRRLVDALRPYDLTLGLQLMQSGRQVLSGPSVAPSPVPLNSRAPTPRELRLHDIDRIVGDYARAATIARDAGFDYVEVHGAHGYLPSNFLSALDNRRTDGYGGNLRGRARFSLEVAEAIRSAVDLPLVWRLNADDGIPGSFELDESVQVARWLINAGAAAISVTSGTWRSLQLTLAPMSVSRGHLVASARAIKQAIAAPVIAVGRLDDPAVAADVVTSGAADLVLIGRGLIAEPDWPAKVAAGEPEQLRPCIACNACVELSGRGERVRCSVNPEVGRESSWQVRPADKPRRIMVIGSGPAGMEAARVACLRGHDVSLWERADRLGGKLEVAGTAPSKHEVLRFRDYQSRTITDLGVDIHLNQDVGVAAVDAIDPDVVIVATGADPLVPPIPGISAPTVHDAQEYLRGEHEVRTGDRVVVVGGSATGCETAEALVALGASVTIVEMRRSIGHGIESITRRELLRALQRDGVAVLTDCTVVGVEADRVDYETRAGEVASLPAEHIVLAIGWRPRGAELRDALPGRVVTVLGDAERPGDFVQAINAGADVGLVV